MTRLILLFVIAATLGIAGCASTSDRLLDSGQSQVGLRSIESRAFDTTDKLAVMRAVVSSMQDLGFIVSKADTTLGTVSGSKFDKGKVSMTVIVRPHGPKQCMVRANANYKLKQITDPKVYQSFFNVLSKALFLQAQQVE
ncbi:MAG: hypothetical protein L0H29_01155 [Sinobacteraceae bacterium]|nr:hypothetical protein [Nevskiaceae bacterium]